METNQRQYLVIGQGQIGSQVSCQLAKLGYKVTGMARKEAKDYSLSDGVGFIQADATQVVAEQLQDFHHVVIIVSPSVYSEQGYRDSYLAVAKHIASLQADLPNLQRLIFISSTGIYGQDAGEWIDDTTMPITPSRVSSQVILQAEKVLQSTFGELCVIIRPSGIYGKDRRMRIRQAQEADKPAMAEYAWTNRIMDTDLVTIIVNVLTITTPKPIYLATDYQPVTSYQLSQWLCQQLATEQPTVNNEWDSECRVSGKRIHSNIPLDWLTYPDWQQGYRHIINDA